MNLPLVLALAVVIIDQLSKWAVVYSMFPGQSIPLVEGLFYLTYVRNPGAAFGLLAYKTSFFILATIGVVIITIMVYRRMEKTNVLLRLGLALQTGGALGNLIDRLRSGYVVDFLDFRVWPVFNLADTAIVIGVAFLVWEIFHIHGEGRETVGGEMD